MGPPVASQLLQTVDPDELGVSSLEPCGRWRCQRTNALAQSLNGSYKTELIHAIGPEALSDDEIAAE